MNAKMKLIAVTAVGTVVQFSLAIWARGGWQAFVAHKALVGLACVTAGMMIVAPMTSGNLNTGIKEDRGNRWVLKAFALIAIVNAFLPAYTDRKDFWTIDGETTRWIGLAVFALGGVMRIYPVFVLGKRFSGLVAIQEDHQLVTNGIYTVIRNPSYLGMVLMLLGWGLTFRAGIEFVLIALLLVPLVARIRAEERLLRGHFGAEYERYCAHTWRLIPGIY